MLMTALLETRPPSRMKPRATLQRVSEKKKGKVRMAVLSGRLWNRDGERSGGEVAATSASTSGGI
jgi:hypothetical protein